MDSLEQYITALELVLLYGAISIGTFMFAYGYYALLGQAGKYYKRRGQKYPRWLVAAAWVFILLVDGPYNILILSVWFREIPRQWTVTDRLKLWRRKYGAENYHDLSNLKKRRKLFADWLCDDMLDYHDVTGDHC